MSKIKEYFQSLVKAGTIPQEPTNYDAATLKIYIDHLGNFKYVQFIF